MKARTILALLLCVAPLSMGCASEAEPDNAEAPYAYFAASSHGGTKVDAGPAEGGAEDGLIGAFHGLPSGIARNEMTGALALTSLHRLISAFLWEGAVLDRAKSPELNAASIAAEIQKSLSPPAVVTYTPNSAFVIVDFGAASNLRGLTMSGPLRITVGAGTASLTIGFVFTHIVMDGYTVDGFASIWTADPKVYSVDVSLMLDGLGSIAFQGETSGLESDVGAVTIDGKGSWKASVPVASPHANGWACTRSSQSTLTMSKVHRASSDCYAGGGTVNVTTPFACALDGQGSTQVPTVLLAKSTISFLSSTPDDGSVKVEVEVSRGGSSFAEAVTSMTKLPAKACSGPTNGG